MNAHKVNEAISLAHILIITVITGALECLLGLDRLLVARSYMKFQEILLKKLAIAVLTCMRQGTFMLLQMIVHGGLNARRIVAVRADELALGILDVLIRHFNGEKGLYAQIFGVGRHQFFLGGGGCIGLKSLYSKELNERR